MHGLFTPKHVVTRIEGHRWALDPADASAQAFLFTILGSGGNDDDVVACSRTGLELLVDVCADATAELRIEFGYINDLHSASSVQPGTLSVDAGPELCSERRSL